VCTGSGWEGYKKAQSWSAGLVKDLYLMVEPGVYCLLQTYWLNSYCFVQCQNYLAMFGFLQSRWRVAADWAWTFELALPANKSRFSRLPVAVVPGFHTRYGFA
jgi:hypothetical protein